MSPDNASPDAPRAPSDGAPRPSAPSQAPPPDADGLSRDASRRRRVSGRLGWALALAFAAALAGLAFVVLQNGTAIQDALAQHDAYIESLDDSLKAIPRLSDAEIALLRRSRNDRHVELAETYGLDQPPVTRAGIDSLVQSGALVKLPAGPGYVAWDGEHSDPYMTAPAAAVLDSIAARFGQRLDLRGLPRVEFTVSSVLRSDEDQALLRGVNSNAAAGRSSHSYGTTFDITYKRYAWTGDAPPPPPPLDGVPALTRTLLADYLSGVRAEAFERFTTDYPSRYEAMLGRVLIELEDAGVLAVVRERRQPVYHVTAAGASR